MDSITQIQNYVKTIAAAFSSTLEMLNDEAPPLPADFSGNEQPHFAPLHNRAQDVFSMLVETDLLLASLPEKFSTEQEQLKELERLSEKNIEVGERLEIAREEAIEWNKKLNIYMGKLFEDFTHMDRDHL